jgi:DNA-binding HxlR family transcriptional regulator
MDEEDDPTPPLGAGSPGEAREIRESLTESERERVEQRVAELLDMLGRTHMMAVLSEFAFANEPLRFSEIEAATAIPPNTLSTRLQELTDAGLLDRKTYDEVPPRVEYSPTPRARMLFPVFGHLHRWAMEEEL